MLKITEPKKVLCIHDLSGVGRCSLAVILLVLPAALMLLDGLICRTTYHWLTAPNAAKE